MPAKLETACQVTHELKLSPAAFALLGGPAGIVASLIAPHFKSLENAMSKLSDELKAELDDLKATAEAERAEVAAKLSDVAGTLADLQTQLDEAGTLSDDQKAMFADAKAAIRGIYTPDAGPDPEPVDEPTA